jgi:hypothetical protein
VGERHSPKADKRLSFAAGPLLAAVLAGAVGGAALQSIRDTGVAGGQGPSTPVIILSIGDLLRDGTDALEIRALADRLAEGGFIVLDAQAVLAAPSELYLHAGQGTAP